MAAGFTSMYVLGSLANALVHSISSRNQQVQQKAIQKENFSLQHDLATFNRMTALLQMQHQKKLALESYKQRIAETAKQFTMINGWPLKVDPSVFYSNFSTRMRGDVATVPLNIIFANPAKSGIQRNLLDVWVQLTQFIERSFPLNGSNPVWPYHGGYKDTFSGSDADVMVLFHGLKNIPTMFMAPYSVENDNILGIKTAIWGIGVESSGPKVENFEIDVRGMYFEVLRNEAMAYDQKIAQGILPHNSSPRIEANSAAFKKEQELLMRGNTFEELLVSTEIYKQIKPSEKTYLEIGNQIVPALKLLSAMIADYYFIFDYGQAPCLPSIVKSEELLNGKETQSQLLKEYCKIISENYIAGTSTIAPVSMVALADGMSIIGLGDQVAGLLSAALDNSKGCLPREYLFSAHQAMFALSNGSDHLKAAVSPDIKEKLVKWENYKSSPDCLEKVILGKQQIVSNEYYTVAKRYLARNNYPQAFQFLVLASEENPEAMTNLGVCFIEGLGCEKSTKHAILCFQKAADAGNATAMRNLAICYGRSQGRSVEEIRQLLERAANAGDVEAAFQLGVLFFKMHDMGNCRIFLSKASKQGHEDATTLLRELTKPQGERSRMQNQQQSNKNKNTFERTVEKIVGGVFDMFDRRSYRPEVFKRASYDDLLIFAQKCKINYPEAVLCRVISDYNSQERRYRITQLLLNSQGKALREGNGCVGRSFFSDALDDRIVALTADQDPAQFDIPLHGSEDKND
jgi:tetratricopeptide (TPR) repeat protein